jgi:hypothetical protein
VSLSNILCSGGRWVNPASDYDEGYHNELMFHTAVAGTGIPVVHIHACGRRPRPRRIGSRWRPSTTAR